MNLIKDYYMNMIENNSEDIKQSLENIKHQKNNFDNNYFILILKLIINYFIGEYYLNVLLFKF